MTLRIYCIADAAKLIGSISVIVGVIIAVYRFYQSGKKTETAVKAIQKENTLQCYCILACLRGLAEQGCNGPVHDGIHRMEKYLNQHAHEYDEN